MPLDLSFKIFPILLPSSLAIFNSFDALKKYLSFPSNEKSSAAKVIFFPSKNEMAPTAVSQSPSKVFKISLSAITQLNVSS